MNNSGFTAIGSTATGAQCSRWTPSRILPSVLVLGLFLSFGAGQARAQCGSLSAPSTTWQNGGNSFWNIDGNWTSGTPTASTNACILNGTSTVTLNTTGSANALQLAFGNNLAITGAGSLTLVGASVNSGSIMNSGSFTNNGTINANPNDQFDGAITSIGLLTNTGVINVSQLTNDGTMNNSGQVGNGLTPATQTEFTNNGTLNNTGIVFTNENHALTNFGTVNNNNQVIAAPFGRIINVGTFNNNGMLVLTDASSFLSNSGTLNNNGTISNAGLFGNSGTINNSGTFNNLFGGGNGGTINNTGTFNDVGVNSGTINNSGTLTYGFGENDGIIINSGTFNHIVTPGQVFPLLNFGTITNTGTLNNISGATLTNSGVLNNSGTFTNNGTFTNAGAVSISSAGLFTTSTNYTQTAGSTIVNGTLSATGSSIVDIQGGVLGGTGTINGDVLMKGILSPGSNGIPGALTINGNYEQGSTGAFDDLISGANSNGVLDVTGILALDPGSLLEITLRGGFDPVGDSFTILDYGSLAGEFSNGTSFFADGFNWTLTYGPNDAVLKAVSAPEPCTIPLIALGFLAMLGYAAKREKESSKGFN